MYGSVFRMKPKPGARDAVLQDTEQWYKERGKDVPGFVASYALEAANGDIIGVAFFENEETYRRNAADPGQDAWYQRLRANLEADPEWNDGLFRTWHK